jgi:hypothetical protein
LALPVDYLPILILFVIASTIAAVSLIFWLLTTLENVRIKILVIAGRLIDVAIIHGDGPLLRNLST